MVSGHYDHVGVVSGRIYHGADDNASGTAATLAVAQALANEQHPRNVLIALWSAEEIGLIGSNAFITTPPVPLDQIAAVHHGSTTGIHEGFGSFGSRASVMGGSAIMVAAENLKKTIREAAARHCGCAADAVAIVDGLRAVAVGGQQLRLSAFAAEGIEAAGTFSNSKRTYSYGAHAAHIAVDAQTGQIEVLE